MSSGVRKENTAALYDSSIYNPPDYNKNVSSGDNPVSSCRSRSRAKGPGTRAGALPMARALYAEGPRGLGGAPRGPVGPPGPLGLAALIVDGLRLGVNLGSHPIATLEKQPTGYGRKPGI